MKSRWLLLPLALLLTLSTSHAQSVAGFVHAKIQNFQQTSSAAPVPDAAQPFQFGSLVNQGTATINSATLTFSGGASPRTYTPVGTGDFSILDTFATQALLDASYGSGNYNLSANTSDGILTRTIFLFPFSYPTTPRLTVPAGDWQNNVLVIDAALDYTFTWVAFSNAQAPDLIQLAIRGSGSKPEPVPRDPDFLHPPRRQPATGHHLRFRSGLRARGRHDRGRSEFRRRLCPPPQGHRLHHPHPHPGPRARLRRLAQDARSRGRLRRRRCRSPATPGVECRTGGATGDHTIVFTFSNPDRERAGQRHQRHRERFRQPHHFRQYRRGQPNECGQRANDRRHLEQRHRHLRPSPAGYSGQRQFPSR